MAKNKFEDLFAAADEDFDGLYGKELSKLKGLSKKEIDSITPHTELHLALIKVVENASKQNLTQAELIHDIKNLGDKAVEIAKMIPQFAKLLA